ncbi:MAG: hypothetical protein GY803_24155 [Chloroflexi bacterium]|nr:hypothetical protein [Chloroflexota bacterium]
MDGGGVEKLRWDFKDASEHRQSHRRSPAGRRRANEKAPPIPHDLGRALLQAAEQDWAQIGPPPMSLLAIRRFWAIERCVVNWATLDGKQAPRISSELRGDVDLTKANTLAGNANIAFYGAVKVGSFDIDSSEAKTMISSQNTGGKSNREVTKPFINGIDITRRF